MCARAVDLQTRWAWRRSLKEWGDRDTAGEARDKVARTQPPITGSRSRRKQLSLQREQRKVCVPRPSTEKLSAINFHTTVGTRSRQRPSFGETVGTGWPRKPHEAADAQQGPWHRRDISPVRLISLCPPQDAVAPSGVV